MILTTILEKSGLREGEEYTTQESHTDEDGTRVRPDVIVRLPNGQRVVVDSKVSLTAFENYVNASTEEERVSALTRHLTSVKAHLRGLSAKNYQVVADSQLDFVIMFIPIEGALAATLQAEPDLTAQAAELNVAIATPTTLMVALKTIANVWHVERRNRNAEEIADRAGKLYNNFVGFLGDMENLRDRIDGTRKTYDAAMGKLCTGGGNLVRQSEMLRNLGAKATKALSTGLIEASTINIDIPEISDASVDVVVCPPASSRDGRKGAALSRIRTACYRPSPPPRRFSARQCPAPASCWCVAVPSRRGARSPALLSRPLPSAHLSWHCRSQRGHEDGQAMADGALDNLRIDGERLLARLEQLGRIGDTGDGGCRRLALTDADRAGRDQLVAWMHELGLDVRIDRIGNIAGIASGREETPAVILGSHIDTVATGGRYDGALGVLAGLEVIAALRAAGITTRRPLTVVAFTNEEGVRFQPDMMGACVWAGTLSLQAAYDTVGIDGARLGDELDRIGYVGLMEPGGIPAHAFLELHIEQGPILDEEGDQIGAVDGVQAITWLELTLTGEANHAGTTPMRYRRDAGFGAAAIIAAARAVTGEIEGQVANAGQIAFEPGNVNVVPRRAVFTLDLRNPRDKRQAEAERRVRAIASQIAEDQRLELSIRDLARFPSVRFDPDLVAVVESATRALGGRVRRITSGAGHDAQIMAGLVPTAMIFVPSANGLSHNPAEYTSPEDLVRGANVLLHATLRVANA